MSEKPFFVEIYRTKSPILRRPEHRWRAVHRSNGEVLASGEGYRDRMDMLDTVEILFGADVVVASD